MDIYVYGIDYGDIFTDVYLFQTHQVVYVKYVQPIVYQSYLNKVV